MSNNIIIQDEETGRYIMSLYVGRTTVVKPIVFTDFQKNAIHFENIKEAQATIKFIGEVMDWELEDQLRFFD